MPLKMITVLALFIATTAFGFLIGIGVQQGAFLVCTESDACVREWISATSGWAAVCAAVPTILYLSKQIRDADRHQRTNFAIQLRRHRLLAMGVAQLAYVFLSQIELALSKVIEGEAPDIRDWNKELIQEMIRHLRGTNLQSFEDEIAFPVSIGAYGMLLIVERGYAGDDVTSFAAPDIVKEYFENVARQAEEFLAETRKITEAN